MERLARRMSWMKLGVICKQILVLEATGVDETSKQSVGGQKHMEGGVVEDTNEYRTGVYRFERHKLQSDFYKTAPP